MMTTEQLLLDSGIRVTTPRVVVYDYIFEYKTHPTCEEIYGAIKDENPSLSLASVYNVTDKLTDEKLLTRLVSPNGDKRYDANTKFHGHFYCEECGKVYDFDCKRGAIFERLEGFETKSVELTAKGLCSNCSKD